MYVHRHAGLTQYGGQDVQDAEETSVVGEALGADRASQDPTRQKASVHGQLPGHLFEKSCDET